MLRHRIELCIFERERRAENTMKSLTWMTRKIQCSDSLPHIGGSV